MQVYLAAHVSYTHMAKTPDICTIMNLYYYYYFLHHGPITVPEPCGYAVLLLII